MMIHQHTMSGGKEERHLNVKDKVNTGNHTVESFNIVSIKRHHSYDENASVYSFYEEEIKADDPVSTHSNNHEFATVQDLHDNGDHTESNEIILLENDGTDNHNETSHEDHEIGSDNSDNDDCVVTAVDKVTKKTNPVVILKKKKGPKCNETMVLRRSSRTIKCKKYDDEIQPLDDGSDIEEVFMEDPLKRKSKHIGINNTNTLEIEEQALLNKKQEEKSKREQEKREKNKRSEKVVDIEEEIFNEIKKKNAEKANKKDIHEHQKIDPPLRDVRVLLKRLSPQRVPDVPDAARPPGAQRDRVPDVPDAAQPPAEASTSRLRQYSTPNRQVAGVQKRAPVPRRATESIVESEIIKSLKPMQLRNRTIYRNWVFSNNAKEVMRAKRVVAQSSRRLLVTPTRRESETSAEDNKPLACFADNRQADNRQADNRQAGNRRTYYSQSDPASEPENSLLVEIPPPRDIRPSYYTAGTERNPTKKKIGVRKKRSTSNKKKPASKGRKKVTTTVKKGRGAKLSKRNTEKIVETVAPQTHVLSPSRRLVFERSSYTESECEYWRDTPIRDLGESARSSNAIVDHREESPSSIYTANDHFNPKISNVYSYIHKSNLPAEVEHVLNWNKPQQQANSMADERDPTSNPPNPLEDFLINVFNWVEDSETDVTGREDINNDSSLIRVQEWLTNTNQRPSSSQTAQTEFKVPETPRRRESRGSLVRRPSSSASSIRSALPIALFLKERKLRKYCTAWNYESFCSIITKPALIRRFCTECTRCSIMFQLKRFSNTSRSVTDVYEFQTHREDEPRVDFLSFRTNQEPFIENPMFKEISKHPNYMAKLKEYMTSKGKKMLQAAVIINKKIHNLLPKEKTILAEVIGILAECNLVRNQNITLPQPAQTATQQSQDALHQPGPSRGRLLDDSDAMQRPNIPQHSIPKTIAPMEGTLRQSLKLIPTKEDFLQCPVSFAYKVLRKYPGTGVCGIKPPSDFKPACKIDPPIEFKASNQYLHRMFERWGPVTRELTAIRTKQEPKIQRSPLFDGLEVDLVKLFHAVQDEEGKTYQNDQQKWQTVAKKMKINCSNPSTKLKNLYLKYLHSYDSITSVERDQIITKVDMSWMQRDKKTLEQAQKPLWRQQCMRNGNPLSSGEMSDMEKLCTEVEACVTPGRYCTIKCFKKMSQQVLGTYFPNNPRPTPEEVELEYWDIVMSATAHVCVHAASIDAAEHRSGFTDDLSDNFFNHPWNLKCLRKNRNNLLTNLGPSFGVSSPSLHLGMLFSTSCWHMNPTSVPWIEYLHTGPPKIWYSIIADQAGEFKAAAEAMCPFAVQNKEIWLPCDVIMIPPNMLRQYGVNVERHVQHEGEFVIVYPNTYCACIDTGFSVSEGVHFAPHDWINKVESIYLNLRTNCEPSLFSMEKLLISMVQDQSTPYALLQRVNIVLVSLLRSELSYRHRMVNRGIELMLPEVSLEQNRRSSSASWQIQDTGECAYCRCHLYLSRVIGVTEGHTSVCAMHGLHLFEHAVSRQNQLTNVFCIVLISNKEINKIMETLRNRLMGRAVF